MLNALSSWSGGKDSAYAVYLAQQTGFTARGLLNVLNENGKISRSHGLPVHLLQQQAEAMNLPLYTLASSWNAYESNFIHALQEMKTALPVSHVIFGDIDLQAHRDWEEKVCSTTGLTAYLPLWQKDRKKVVLSMLEAKFEAIIVSCQATMGLSYLGRTIDLSLVEELESRGIDPCGENGEFHTLVTNCPLFSTPVQFTIAGKSAHENYCFLNFTDPTP